jgi:hypothetical protein
MCRVSQTSAGKSPPAGPDVSLWFDQLLSLQEPKVILRILLRNGGASAEVESLMLWRLKAFKYKGLLSTFRYNGLLDLRVPGRVDVLEGPPGFPFRIGSNASVRMKLNVREVEVRHGKLGTVESDDYSRRFFTQYGRLTAVLGNGAEVQYTRWWWSQHSAQDVRERERWPRCP